MRSTADGWLPIENLPVGLITWYAPGGAPMALATSWLGVIEGHPPALWAGCGMAAPGTEQLPLGTDFAVNFPLGQDLPILRELLRESVPGTPLPIEAGAGLVPARAVRAPLLGDCALRFECAVGRSVAHAWEAVLAGDILLFHRGGQVVDPVDHPDFCALHPLRLPLVS